MSQRDRPRCIDCGAQQVTLDNRGRCIECFAAYQSNAANDPSEYEDDITLPKVPSMPEDDLIPVQWTLMLPRDTVAFIEREAHRRTEEHRRTAPDSTASITVESLASEYLYAGALLAFLELSETLSDDDKDPYFPPVPQDGDD